MRREWVGVEEERSGMVSPPRQGGRVVKVWEKESVDFVVVSLTALRADVEWRGMGAAERRRFQLSVLFGHRASSL